jgi:transposase
MLMRLEPTLPVLEATTRFARPAFPRGNAYMQIRDELETGFDDTSFAGLFPERGWTAEAPGAGDGEARSVMAFQLCKQHWQCSSP